MIIITFMRLMIKQCEKLVFYVRLLCQANRLNIVELPKFCQDIRRLERLLVSRKFLFKKVRVMPKGKSLKIKDSICNIPLSENDVNCNMLPRTAHSNGLIVVNLKRKLEYKGHVVFEAVRLDVVIQFLEILRNHNDLYSDIETNPANISVDILCFQRFKTGEDTILQLNC